MAAVRHLVSKNSLILFTDGVRGLSWIISNIPLSRYVNQRARGALWVKNTEHLAGAEIATHASSWTLIHRCKSNEEKLFKTSKNRSSNPKEQRHCASYWRKREPWRNKLQQFPVASGLAYCNVVSVSFPSSTLTPFRWVVHAAGCTVLDLKPRVTMSSGSGRSLLAGNLQIADWDIRWNISLTYWYVIPVVQIPGRSTLASWPVLEYSCGCSPDFDH